MAKARANVPKGKAATPEFRTIGLRTSREWAAWLAKAAKSDRVDVAKFLERAAIAYAKQIGFTDSPPDRLP
jgi:uncharacterized protein (DUF1778 family)